MNEIGNGKDPIRDYPFGGSCQKADTEMRMFVKVFYYKACSEKEQTKSATTKLPSIWGSGTERELHQTMCDIFCPCSYTCMSVFDFMFLYYFRLHLYYFIPV